MKKQNYPLIIVEWNDVSTHDGWRSTKEIAKKSKLWKAKMVGWEIARDKNKIVIATAFSETECNGRRTIPIGCINKIKRLE